MFTFSLQTVLEVRERLEKIKYKEFSNLLYERQKLDQEVQSRNTQIESAATKLDEIRRQGITALAQDIPNQDGRVDFERQAKRMLDKVA